MVKCKKIKRSVLFSEKKNKGTVLKCLMSTYTRSKVKQ